MYYLVSTQTFSVEGDGGNDDIDGEGVSKANIFAS